MRRRVAALAAAWLLAAATLILAIVMGSGFDRAVPGCAIQPTLSRHGITAQPLPESRSASAAMIEALARHAGAEIREPLTLRLSGTADVEVAVVVELHGMVLSTGRSDRCVVAIYAAIAPAGGSATGPGPGVRLVMEYEGRETSP